MSVVRLLFRTLKEVTVVEMAEITGDVVGVVTKDNDVATAGVDIISKVEPLLKVKAVDIAVIIGDAAVG